MDEDLAVENVSSMMPTMTDPALFVLSLVILSEGGLQPPHPGQAVKHVVKFDDNVHDSHAGKRHFAP